MKSFVFFSLMLSSVFAFAQELPYGLDCKATYATSTAVQSFQITDLNTTRTDSTLPDTSYIGRRAIRNQIVLSFSNECDNSYDVSLPFKKLADLNKGEIEKIYGQVEYTDSQLLTISETVEITCTRLD